MKQNSTTSKNSMKVSSLLLLVCTTQFLLIVYLLLQSTHHADNEFKLEESNLFEVEHNISITSHMFCYGGASRDDRQCHFRNLCYSRSLNQFIFYEDSTTEIYGIVEDGERFTAFIDLSSVSNHDAMFFHLKSMTTGPVRDVWFYSKPSILMKRFNPDNVMHVIHDDLIPLLHTQRRYFPSQANISYIFMDDRDEGPYFELYHLLSSDILTLKDLPAMTCFKNVIVGVSKTTTWYQYGFQSPQGALNITDYPRNELEYFKKHIISALDITQSEHSEEFVVYFSRSVTRRIINEAQFVFGLMKYFKRSVKTVSLEQDSMKDIVSLVSNAAVVVGVHGAHFSLSVFMKPGTLLIEIFPFAIPAIYFTPYKTLCQLKSIQYIAWENTFENNIVTHEDWPPHMGGIQHLSHDLQSEIRNKKRIDQHLCCHDPFWLFRIYQDTIVNQTDFFQFISNRLT